MNFNDRKGLAACPAGSENNCIEVIDSYPTLPPGSGGTPPGVAAPMDTNPEGQPYNNPYFPSVGGGFGTQLSALGNCFDLSKSQEQLLGNGDAAYAKFRAFSFAQQIAFLNFTAASAAAGVNLGGFSFARFGNNGAPDRIFLTAVDPDAGTTLAGNLSQPLSGFTSGIGPTHPGMSGNFRQDVPFFSLQIGTSAFQIEIDIDYGAPHQGLLPALLHAVEWAWNGATGSTTNPYVVYHVLRERGVDTGFHCPGALKR
ncbi:MAG: hypothetical protein INH43_27650 [Acidobacteriaceae bacterium]|nr:hypothetical protein [Acidobacteriaceae bacterium]